MAYAALPQKSLSDAASDRASALIARAEIRKERVLDDSSVNCWNLKNIDNEIKTYYVDTEERWRIHTSITSRLPIAALILVRFFATDLSKAFRLTPRYLRTLALNTSQQATPFSVST